MASNEKEVFQNFRSNYYQKLGSATTTAIEEKKNLRKLLNNTPMDIRKLEQFTQLMHQMPNDFRLDLWKVLLSKSVFFRVFTVYFDGAWIEIFR